MDLPIVDGCRHPRRGIGGARRVRQPVVLALVAAIGAQLVAAAATRAHSLELRSTPTSARSAQAERPALERMAFMAGGALRFPTFAGEHLVVARGNALEVWHAASGEARGHLALPRGVRGIAVEVGPHSADALTETRIVATYGQRGLAVVALSAGGELRQVALYEIVSLDLEAGSGPPTVFLDPGIALVDGLLYLPRRGVFTGYDDAMLTVAELHQDGSLTVVGETALGRGEVWQMLRHGDHLYGLIGRTVHQARSADRPFVVDITQRDRPRLLADGALDASGAPRDFGWLSGIAIAGRHLLVSEAGPLDPGAGGDPDAPGALHVLNVSDPAAPRQVGELPVAPRPVALAAHGTQALIVGDRLTAGWVGGGPEPATLVRVDLGRPEAPRIVDRTAIERSTLGVAMDGRRAAVSTHGGDLAVYDGLADGTPRRAWEVEGPGAVLGIAADADVAVARFEASAGQREVVVLDVRDARRPRAIARVPDSGGVSRLALRGDVLLMVEADGFGLLRVVDLSRPDAPVERGRIDGREQGEGLWMGRMAWRSDHEIVFGGRERLSTVDLSDLDRPFVRRSWLHGLDDGGLLDVEGDVALVGSGFGPELHLVALDERSGDRQHAIAGLDSGGPITFDLHQGRAWIADERDVRVVEIEEEPLGHRSVAVYERLLERGPAGTPIRRWDRYLLAVEWDRLRVFDTQVDGPPVEQQVIGMPEQIVDVAIDGDRVYVAALEGGLHVFGAAAATTDQPWRIALPLLRVGFVGGGGLSVAQGFGSSVLALQGNVLREIEAESGEEIAALRLPHVAEHLAIDDRWAYAYGGDHISTIDLQAAEGPTLAATSDLRRVLGPKTVPSDPDPVFYPGLMATGDHVYVAIDRIAPTSYGAATAQIYAFRRDARGELVLVSRSPVGAAPVAMHNEGARGAIVQRVQGPLRALSYHVRLLVLDDPASPRVLPLQGDDVGEPRWASEPRIALDDELLLIADRGAPRLQLWPTTGAEGLQPPRRLGSLALTGVPQELWAADGVAWLRLLEPGTGGAATRLALLRIGLSDPARPSIEGRAPLTTEDPLLGPLVGERLHFGGEAGRLSILAWIAPRESGGGESGVGRLAEVATYRGIPAIHSATVDGDRMAFTAGRREGSAFVGVLDAAPSGMPRLASRVPARGPVTALSLGGDLLLVAGPLAAGVPEHGLHVVDVSRPGQPSVRGGLAWRVPVQGLSGPDATGHAVAVGDGWLATIDLRDPDRPRVVAELAVDGDGHALHVNQRGGRALVHGARADNVHVIDVADQSAPRVVATLPASQESGAALTHAAWLGERVVVVRGGRVRAFDPAVGEPDGGYVDAGNWSIGAGEATLRGGGIVGLVGRLVVTGELLRVLALEPATVGAAASTVQRLGLPAPGVPTTDGRTVLVAAGDGGLHVWRVLPGDMLRRAVLPWVAR